MVNQVMDMINGSGYLLIPGFSALFLLLVDCCSRTRLEKEHCLHARKPVMKSRRNHNG